MVNKKEQITDEELMNQLLGDESSQAIESKGWVLDLAHKKWGAEDLVKVKNFLDHKIGYVYSDRKTLRIEQPNEFTRRVWQGERKARVIGAGKTLVIPGWEAYSATNQIFNAWVQEEYPKDIAVNMNSPRTQLKFLDAFFVGIYDPNEEEEPEIDAKQEVEKDLGLKDGEKKSK